MFFGVCNIKDIILSSDNNPMMIDQLYANNISIISISLCFAQHGCKADIVVKFWQPLCGDRKHHPLIVDSFGPYGEGGGGLIAGWGQLIWRKCPPSTPGAHHPVTGVPNLFCRLLSPHLHRHTKKIYLGGEILKKGKRTHISSGLWVRNCFC